MQSRTDGMWWGLAIESPDPHRSAAFYADLLNWPIGHEEPETSIVAPPGGTTYLVFQQADDYQPPTWPTEPDAQRPMMHLDFQVGDLDQAVREALQLGATLAEHQPNATVRVLYDPAGRPFCLCLDD